MFWSLRVTLVLLSAYFIQGKNVLRNNIIIIFRGELIKVKATIERGRQMIFAKKMVREATYAQIIQ